MAVPPQRESVQTGAQHLRDHLQRHPPAAPPSKDAGLLQQPHDSLGAVDLAALHRDGDVRICALVTREHPLRERLLLDIAEEGRDAGTQTLFDRGDLRSGSGDAPAKDLGLSLQQVDVEVALGCEVVVEHGGGDACGPDDALDRRLLVAVARKLPKPSGRDHFAPLLGPQPSPRPLRREDDPRRPCAGAHGRVASGRSNAGAPSRVTAPGSIIVRNGTSREIFAKTPAATLIMRARRPAARRPVAAGCRLPSRFPGGGSCAARRS